MKIVVQRVHSAKVSVERKIVGKIQKGLLLFIGITHEDQTEAVEWLAEKIAHLRIFEDGDGKMNRSLLEEQGSILAISQFTLYGDCEKGRRPSFIRAAHPTIANQLYEQMIQLLRLKGIAVETGVFGAKMEVSLVNDGPVTLILER